jgi:hypothetical protein
MIPSQREEDGSTDLAEMRRLDSQIQYYSREDVAPARTPKATKLRSMLALTDVRQQIRRQDAQIKKWKAEERMIDAQQRSLIGPSTPKSRKDATKWQQGRTLRRASDDAGVQGGFWRTASKDLKAAHDEVVPTRTVLTLARRLLTKLKTHLFSEGKDLTRSRQRVIHKLLALLQRHMAEKEGALKRGSSQRPMAQREGALKSTYEPTHSPIGAEAVGRHSFTGDGGSDDVLITRSPETASPETPSPHSKAPETLAPEQPVYLPGDEFARTATPETATPETPAPDTLAPETLSPVGESAAMAAFLGQRIADTAPSYDATVVTITLNPTITPSSRVVLPTPLPPSEGMREFFGAKRLPADHDAEGATPQEPGINGVTEAPVSEKDEEHQADVSFIAGEDSALKPPDKGGPGWAHQREIEFIADGEYSHRAEDNFIAGDD